MRCDARGAATSATLDRGLFWIGPGRFRLGPRSHGGFRCARSRSALLTNAPVRDCLCDRFRRAHFGIGDVLVARESAHGGVNVDLYTFVGHREDGRLDLCAGAMAKRGVMGRARAPRARLRLSDDVVSVAGAHRCRRLRPRVASRGAARALRRLTQRAQARDDRVTDRMKVRTSVSSWCERIETPASCSCATCSATSRSAKNLSTSSNA